MAASDLEFADDLIDSREEGSGSADENFIELGRKPGSQDGTYQVVLNSKKVYFVPQRYALVFRKATSVMDSRRYKFVTCKYDEYQELIGADDQYKDHVLYLNREQTLTNQSNPQTALAGTNSNYHFRTGTEAFSQGNDSSPPEYEIMMGKHICGCPECRKGEFEACINQDAIGRAVSRITRSRVNY
jgi:hypothetical protein